MCVGASPSSSSDDNARELGLPPAERSSRSPTASSRFKATPAADTRARNMALSPAERNREAISNVMERVNANERRMAATNPLMPGGAVVSGLYAASNFFNARIIDGLQRGGTPVMDTSGNVTGSRDSRNRLTGRDLADEAAEERRQQRQQQDDQDERSRRAAAQPQPPAASATAPPVPNTNRRPIIYEDQARSGASSRGPGRRSLLSP